MSHKQHFSALLLFSIAQIPGGPPSTPPEPSPRPPVESPLPDPIIELPASPDPFLDFSEEQPLPETLPPDQSAEDAPLLEVDDSVRLDTERTDTERTVESNLPGTPLAASGALTEVAILGSFLPEPMLTIASPQGENDTATATTGTDTLSASVNPNEGEVQPPESVDIAEPIEPDSPGPESPQNASEDIPAAPSEEPSIGEDSPSQSETADSDISSSSDSSRAPTSLNCQTKVNDLAAADIPSESARSVYQALSVCYQQNLDRAIAAQNKPQEIRSLNNLAVAQFVVGNYLKAKELHEQQLTAAEQQGDTLQMGIARAGIGATFAALGDYPAAIAQYQASLPQLSSPEAAQWRSLTLRNLGNAYYAQQDFAQAEDYQQQSLQLSQDIGDLYGEMQALGNLGNLWSISNKTEAAITHYRQALTLAQSLQYANEEAQILLGLGTTYYYLQNYETASEYYRQSLSLTKRLGAKLGEGIALTNLGEILLKQNRLSEAETALSQSIKIWESLQAGLGNSNRFKISLFETQKAAYRNLQEVLVNSNRDSAALEISERGRTRAFVELLAQGEVETGTAGVIAPPTLSELQQTAIAKQITLVEYAIIRDQFADIPHGASPQQAAPTATNQPEATELYIWVIQPTGQVNFRQVNLGDLSLPLAQLVEQSRSQLKTSGARRIAATRAANSQPVDINTLSPGDFVRRQGDPATWAPYEVTAINLEANTVSVTHPNITLPDPNLSADELLAFNSSSTSAINNPTINNTAETQPALQQLHQLLIEPVANLLPTNAEDPVVFIPQEQLFLIPFAALQNAEGTYLIDQHTILTAPSIQTLRLIEPSTTPLQQNPLIVGNPSPMPQSLAPLPHAQTEAEIISQNLSTSPLTQTNATEGTIKQQLPTAGLIHLATHGFFNESNPFEGSLALAPDNSSGSSSGSTSEDGFLTVSEILEQPLTAQLVVLSACDTGRGRITGDGVIGFSRSFLAAGAARVIVSLWQVPDEATSTLMVEFYQQLQQGQSEAQALRQAMLKTREVYPNPHDWAAFTFIGENSPSQ